MRKLLVTSHKGGVGKTTTAINLAYLAAQAGQRVLLVDADPLGSILFALNLRLPSASARDPGPRKTWAFWNEPFPGCNVLTPFEPGAVPEQKLESLLLQFTASWFPEKWGKYDLLVFDAPPFMGPRARRLLAACDEWVLVLRTEPLGFRTLPPLLQMVKEVQQEGRLGQLQGVLLTTPPDGLPGNSCEQEMRALLGRRALPQTIPYDAEALRALLLHQPLTQLYPQAPAALEYRALAAELRLLSSPATRSSPVVGAARSPRPAPAKQAALP